MVSVATKPKVYECPKCHTRIECVGVVEGHRCPANKTKWVGNWSEVENG